MRSAASLLGALLVVIGCGAVQGSPPPSASPPESAAPVPTELILGQTFALVDDPDVGRVVLVNGATEQGPDRPTELWSWSGSAWELLDASGPPARSFAAVARDPVPGHHRGPRRPAVRRRDRGCRSTRRSSGMAATGPCTPRPERARTA